MLPIEKKIVPVTQPYLPPLDEFLPYLQKIWDSKFLTNNGPFHHQLEAALCEFLGVSNLSLFSNGTIALLTGLQSLQLSGQVITTPYSFVATANSLVWNNLEPIFVDIDPITFNIDPEKIEAAITKNTSAIMPVHCYGNPCNVDAIQRIADQHGLRVIYDAAHAFNVTYNGKSLLQQGDLSIVSFHATKVFNTFEGGAIISPDRETKQRIDNLKNFGFVDDVTIIAAGINGKMSEVNAAFGMLQLKYVESAISRRKALDEQYRRGIADIKGLRVPAQISNTQANYSYFPILVEESYPLSRDALHQKLHSHNFMSRRYFYPLISDMPMYSHLPSARDLPHSKLISDKVLCLPIFSELNSSQVDEILNLLRDI